MISAIEIIAGLAFVAICTGLIWRDEKRRRVRFRKARILDAIDEYQERRAMEQML